jgi:hypothetical protein
MKPSGLDRQSRLRLPDYVRERSGTIGHLPVAIRERYRNQR